jgi:uncharacterized protein YukE
VKGNEQMDKNQADVDPDAIEAATKQLEQVLSRVRDFDAELTRRLVRLSNSFKGDEAYDRFQSRVVASRLLIKKFLDETETVLPQLRHDAERIRSAQHLTPEH